MKILLAPAKTLNLTKHEQVQTTIPKYQNFASNLWTQIQSQDVSELASYYKVSEKLAQKMIKDFAQNQSGHAFYSYSGLVYKQITKDNKQQNYEYINNHILILDALWAILHPSDEIHNYRLDFKISNKHHLTQIKQHHTQAYQDSLHPNEVYINLASNEYINNIKHLNLNIINVTFLNYNKQNKLVQNATKSKMARGSLTNYLITHNITTPQKIKNWNEGFNFEPTLSDEQNIVFVEQKD